MSNQTLGTAVKLACAFTVLLGVTERPANSQPKLAVDGSTGTAPLVAALGKAFTDKTGIAIEVGKGLGTKARFEALAAGKIDVAMASHGLKAGEVTAMGMTVHRIAVTPVVFAVHHSVTARALTDSQLCAIYGGRGRT